MCFFRKKKTVEHNPENLKMPPNNDLLKDIDGEEDDFFFGGITSTNQQNFLDCVVDDDEE